jgi:uncharacterized membrane protein (DUF2068 family)
VINPRIARRLVAIIAVFNGIAGALYFILGCSALSLALHSTEVADGKVSAEHVAPGMRAVLFTLYAIFLFACGVGLWREQPWGWYFGMFAGGFSFVLAVIGLAHRVWGSAAFDAVYGALLVGCLLALRES